MSDSFLSPFSLEECRQRIGQLEERRQFFFQGKRYNLHFRLEKTEISERSSQFFIACSPSRSRMPDWVFLKLSGTITPSKKGSEIRFSLKLNPPFSLLGWLLSNSWIFLLLLGTFFGVKEIRRLDFPQALLLGLLLSVGVGGYFWRLYQTYRLGVKHLSSLFYGNLLVE